MEEEVDVTLIEFWQNLHVVVSHYWNTEDHGKQQEPLRATLYIAECYWECKGSSLSTSQNAVLFKPRPKEPKERWLQKNKRTMEKVCTKTYTHGCGASLIAVVLEQISAWIILRSLNEFTGKRSSAICHCCLPWTPTRAQKPKAHEWSWPWHCCIHQHSALLFHKHQERW